MLLDFVDFVNWSIVFNFKRVREITRAMKDKVEERFVRLGLSLIAFFVVFMIPLVYRNLNFRLFEGVPKAMVVGGTTADAATKFLTNIPNITTNVTHDNSEGRNIFKSKQ